MKLNLLGGALVLCVTACNNSKSPDFVISSTNVLDNQVNMVIYGETQDQNTAVTAYLFKNHKDGYRQYLALVSEDTLQASHVDWTAEFEATLVEPLTSYYDVEYDSGVAGDVVDVEFIRSGAETLFAGLTILDETPFTLTHDEEPIDLQSTITASWQAVEGYSYALGFAFTCDGSNGKKVGFRIQVPNHVQEALVSPFDLDLGQIGPPPTDAVNCGVTVSLIAEQDQSELQVPVSESIKVYARRKQSETVELDNSAAE